MPVMATISATVSSEAIGYIIKHPQGGKTKMLFDSILPGRVPAVRRPLVSGNGVVLTSHMRGGTATISRRRAVLAVLWLPAAIARSANTAGTGWDVTGLWSEACPCKPPCPCWSGSRPTFDHCENVQVFKIDRGHYGATVLNGITVVVVWVAPDGEVMDQAGGHSKLLAFYVDKSTTAAQREAVEKIWRKHFMRGINGKNGGLRAVPLSLEIDREHARVVIPGILNYEVRQSGNKTVPIQDQYLTDFRPGSSVSLSYSDFGANWSYPGKHAMFANFRAKQRQQ